jgi:hypothetical protein
LRRFFFSGLTVGRVIVASTTGDSVVRHSHFERLLQAERQR